ncbi:MAG: hypothetical protein LBR62_02470 [Puniceicoccales bacterium]|jgi:hypothetical protein|nr:hypothetical protein [Puniceicoccales bacterium]
MAPPPFEHHLERIRSATQETQDILADAPKQSVALLWERLFDLLCIGHPDWSEVKAMGDILRKVTQSYTQLKMLEIKLPSHPSDSTSPNAWSLSDQTLAEIEDQLQLL